MWCTLVPRLTLSVVLAAVVQAQVHILMEKVEHNEKLSALRERQRRGTTATAGYEGGDERASAAMTPFHAGVGPYSLGRH